MFDSFIEEPLKALRHTTVRKSATYFIKILRKIFPSTPFIQCTPFIHFEQNFHPPRLFEPPRLFRTREYSACGPFIKSKKEYINLKKQEIQDIFTKMI